MKQRKISKMHLRLIKISVLLSFLFFGLSFVSKGQTYNYVSTSTTLNVDVTISNSCEGNDAGSITFHVNAAPSGSATLLIVSGPSDFANPNAVIPVGSDFTYTPPGPQTGDWDFIIRDAASSLVNINTIPAGGAAPVPIFDLADITIGSVSETDNSDCVTPNGQVVASVSGGSESPALGAIAGSFTYTWTTNNLVSGFPLIGTFDGTSNLDLAALLGRPGLPAGTYSLLIEDNYSDCFETRDFTIADPSPLSFNTGTTTASICIGSGGTITLSNSEGAVLTYEVFKEVASVYTATGITQIGSNGPLSFSIPQSQLTPAGTYNFRVRAVNGSCTPVFMTNTASITVNALPVYNNFTNTPAGICSDAALGLDLQSLRDPASVAATTFNITNIVNNGLSASAGSPAVANGVSSSNLSDDAWTNTGTTPVNVIYTVVPIANGCSGTSFTVTATINPEPTFNNFTNVPLGICSDTNVGVNLGTLQNGGVAATAFNITNIVSNGLSASQGSPAIGNNLTATEISDDRWTNQGSVSVNVVYTIVPVTGGCPGSSFTVTIQVNPEPDYNDFNNAPTGICSDQVLALDLSTLQVGTSAAATTYNITNINNNGLTASAGSPAIGTGLSANEIADDAWTNNTAASVNVIYSITPLVGACSGDPFTVTVQVNPEPRYNNFTNVPTGICSDDIVNVNLSTLINAGSTAATAFNIIGINNNGLVASAGNPAIANNVAATEIADDAWTNSGTTAVNVTYTIAPVGGNSCVGNTFTVTIQVNPEPDYNDFTNVGVGICSDIATGLNLASLQVAGSSAATSFNITNINNNGLSASAGSPAIASNLAANVIADDAWTNTTSNPVNVVYTITPVLGPCTGDPFTVTVQINPEPQYNNFTNAPTGICSDQAAGFDFSTQRVGTSAVADGFNIISINNGGLTASAGSPAVANGLASNVISDDAWTNTTNTFVDVVYTVVPVINGCAGSQFTVTLRVNPEPDYNDFTNAPSGVCSDAVTNVNLATLRVGTSVVATTFNITNIASGGLSASAGAPTTATGVSASEIQNDAWTNNTTVPVDVVYTIVPVTGGCLGDAFTVTIRVNPEPEYNNFTNVPTGICSDVALGLDLNTLQVMTGPTATGFDITNIANGGLSASAGSPAIGSNLASSVLSDDAWTNETNASVDVVYTIAPRFNSCLGDEFTVTVRIHPEPAYNDFSNAPTGICSELATNIDLSALRVNTSAVATAFNIISINSNSLTASAGSPTVANNLAANVIADDAWTNTTSAAVNVVYTIVPVVSGCPGDSFTVTVQVNPQPDYNNFTNVPPGICSDVALNLDLATLRVGTSAVASGFNITNIANGGLTASAGNPAIGSNVPANTLSDDAWTNTTLVAVDVVYTIVPVLNGCTGDPFSVTVRVNPEPAYTNFSNAPTGICSEDVTNFDLSTSHLVTSIAATSFNITNINSNGLSASGGNPMVGNNLPSNAISDDAWTNTTSAPVNVVYTVAPVVSGCSGNSFTVTIQVNPQPDYNDFDNSPVGICSDQVLTLNLSVLRGTTSAAASSFNIIGIVTNGLSASAGTPAIGNNLPVTELADDAWTNTTNAAVNVIYTIVPVLNGCEGNQFTVTVRVNPEPAYDDFTNVMSGGICSDEDISLDLASQQGTGSAAATTFNITAINNGGLSASAGNPAIGTGFPSTIIQDDAWTNTTNAFVDVVYSVTPQIGSCSGDAFTVTIRVNPEPDYNNFTNSPIGICSEQVVGLDLDDQREVTSATATGFNIININANGLTAFAGSPALGNNLASNVIADDAWTNSSSAPVDVVYTIVPVVNGCEGNSFTVTVRINPQPDYNDFTDVTTGVCSDATINLDLETLRATTSGVATSFNIIAINSNLLTASAGNPVTGNTFDADVLEDDSWTNTTSAPIDVVYTIVPVIGTCEGDQFTVIIRIQPEPVYNSFSNSPLGVCSQDASAINLNALHDGTSVTAPGFNITAIASNGLTASAGNPAIGNNLTAAVISDDSWINTTTASVNVVYTIRPVNNSCLGNSFTVTIQVNPEPAYNDFTNAPTGICSEEAVAIDLASLQGVSSATATGFNIISINANGLTATAGNPVPGTNLPASVIADDEWRNATAAAADVVYTIVPVFNGCEGEEFTVTVQINPAPSYDNYLNDNAPGGICSRDVIGINLNDLLSTGSMAATSFEIISINPNGMTAIAGAPGIGTGVNAAVLADDRWRNTSLGQLNVVYTIAPVSSGCAGQQFTVTVTVNPEPVPDISKVDAACSGANDGEITINSVTSGTAPFQYSIDNGVTFQASNTFTGLNTITYQVVVRDANQCTSLAVPVTINATVAIIPTISKTDADCNGVPNGTITVTAVTGGDAPFSYSIDNGATFQPSNVFTDLAGASNHSVIVSDANGCTSSAFSIVINNTATITATTSRTDVSSCVGNDGTITVNTPTGGTAPYMYSLNGGAFQVSPNFTTLTPGSYTIVVRDNGLCLSAPIAVTISTISNIVPVVTKVDASCNGTANGSITIPSVTGGTAPYQYSSDNGANFTTSNSFTALSGNTNYAVVVRDANGCLSSSIAIIINNLNSITAASITKTDVSSCVGTNGQIVVAGVTGGSGVYNYSIDNGSTVQPAGTFNNLTPGTYDVVISDVAPGSCQSTPVSMTIGVIGNIVPVISKVDAACNGVTDGSITVSSVTGGSTPYEYSRDNGATFQTSNVFNSLAAGTYSVVVRDAALCISSVSSIIIQNGVTIVPDVDVTNASCTGTGGVITIASVAPAGTYQYSIDNGVTFQASNSFTALAAGNYNVVVRSATNCLSTVVVATIGTVANIAPVIAKTDAACNGVTNGSITVSSVSGGTAPYEYSVNNGVTYQVSNVFGSLAAGTYAVIVRDAALCVSSVSSIIVQNGLTLSPSINTTNVSCVGGDGVITVATVAGGGAAPLTYSIDNGVTFQATSSFTNVAEGIYAVVVRDNNGCLSLPLTAAVSSNCNGGGPGNPNDDCIKFAGTLPPVATRPSCANQDDGAIEFSIQSADASPTFILTLYDSVASPVFTQSVIVAAGVPYSFEGLSPSDNYRYHMKNATDFCDMPFSLPLQTTVDASLDLASVTNPTCFGSATGAAIINATGSQTGQYFYSLDNLSWKPFVPGTPGQITDLPPLGTYNILVGETAGDVCHTSVEITVNSINPDINATFSVTPATCDGADGAITNLIATGGSGSGYQFSIDGTNFKTDNNFTALSGGFYSVRVRDGSGCEKIIPANVTFPGFINFSYSVIDPTCLNNGNSGALVVKVLDPGTFKIALSQDQFDEPADDQYKNYSDPFITFDNLSRGTYFLYAKSNTAVCPTRSEPIAMQGAYALSFGIEPNCIANDLSVTLTNMMAEPGVPFEIRVYKKVTGVLVETIQRTALSATATEFLEYQSHVFLRNPDDYTLQLVQTSAATNCEIKSPFVDLSIPHELFALVGLSEKSYPDIQNGSIVVTNISGGTMPYSTRIELDSAASFNFPGYETQFEEVQLNNNNQFSKKYDNIPPGRYAIHVTDNMGCVLELTGRVKMDQTVYIPNIFTPNGDSVNDIFFIRNLPSDNVKLVITSRWGKEVYSSKNYLNNWGAEGAADGVYFYQLSIGEEKITGWVEIIRGEKP